MKVDIDTEKLMGWVRFHIQYLIPVGLGFGSWFGIHLVEPNTPIGVWWTVVTTFSGVLSLITGGWLLGLVYTAPKDHR